MRKGFARDERVSRPTPQLRTLTWTRVCLGRQLHGAHEPARRTLDAVDAPRLDALRSGFVASDCQRVPQHTEVDLLRIQAWCERLDRERLAVIVDVHQRVLSRTPPGQKCQPAATAERAQTGALEGTRSSRTCACEASAAASANAPTAVAFRSALRTSASFTSWSDECGDDSVGGLPLGNPAALGDSRLSPWAC
jgi:hypothetical protein